ncbi:MAG TPA: DUF5615 family PIN-like protein, partial [archaeon]|nr:DUF5615 family PIN-like protein [archaeon]
VEDVRDIGLGHASDAAILRAAKASGSIVVTRDLGFGNPEQHPLSAHAGVVILRLPSSFNARQTAAVLADFLKEAKSAPLEGAVTIVELGRYRIRR